MLDQKHLVSIGHTLSFIETPPTNVTVKLDTSNTAAINLTWRFLYKGIVPRVACVIPGSKIRTRIFKNISSGFGTVLVQFQELPNETVAKVYLILRQSRGRRYVIQISHVWLHMVSGINNTIKICS
jgi:hypothetical protein